MTDSSTNRQDSPRPVALPRPTELTQSQRDGVACIYCGSEDGPMVPVAILGGVQVFCHEACR